MTWRAVRRGAIAAALVVAASFALPATAQVDCRIVRADTAVWSDLNASGVVAYYGHVLLYTDGCGELSPADVAATFRPVAGSTTTCDFRGTLRQDEAVCTGGRGAASAGTLLVVTATGRSYGSGGADTFASSCTLVVPHRGRASCPLPVG